MKKAIKKIIIRSPLHKTIMQAKAYLTSRRWVAEGSRVLGHKTVYCISPYKTGTTFLSSCFDPSIAQHESLHYTSIRMLNRDFDRWFIRRLNSLNLKLECSGFLSAYVDQMADNEVARNLNYICVLRKPSAWVRSAVNHHQKVKAHNQNYFWGNELYWKRHVGVDLAGFFENDEKVMIEIAEKMIAFYMQFTRRTAKLENVTYVWLKDLQGFLPELGEMIHEEVRLEKSERNKASISRFDYENESLDSEYTTLVESLTADSN
ncbi:MAG: hypothetical protein HRT65_13325 [Flavobacteriaceae bacterium]|nr:hypothetical protein [Flavobacteriaceae bacterium]